MIQLSIAMGMIAAAGVMLVVRELRPRYPDAVDTAARLTNTTTAAVPSYAEIGSPDDQLRERIGRVMLRHLGTWSILRIPHRDLGLIRMSVTEFLGLKGLYAFIGLVTPTISTMLLGTFGVNLPFTLPVVVGLIAAVVLSYLPNYDVADRAKDARAEFARAMTSYIDLVSLERAGGAGPVQALEHAAEIGDSWVFERLRDELSRARWHGTPAWQALHNVGDELRLPELVETADIMRLAGDQGATVYENLRARASAMRAEILSSDKARAGIRTERSTAPVAMTTVMFLIMLATPMAMQIA